jgi:hypothetical protein
MHMRACATYIVLAICTNDTDCADCGLCVQCTHATELGGGSVLYERAERGGPPRTERSTEHATSTYTYRGGELSPRQQEGDHRAVRDVSAMRLCDVPVQHCGLRYCGYSTAVYGYSDRAC